jgi:shikimate dehydrogenase
VSVIRLGLIGDNIAASRAPELHQIAARMCGLDLTYDLLVPRDLKLDFDATFDRARDQGYRGINITYPYKERVVRRLNIDEPSIRSIGACNTVLFGRHPPAGANTDYTGFLAAFRNSFGQESPGVVAMAGSGGVGRAIGFALAGLRAKALRIYDMVRLKAENLATAIIAVYPGFNVQVAPSIEYASHGADGLVNCTPLGMVGYGGSAFPTPVVRGQRWAFDAVYTPVDTPFLMDAQRAGVAIMSGYELYFYQGVDAFRIFTGHEVDILKLRRAIERPQ